MSQPDVITFDFDPENDGTPVERDYSRFDTSGANRTVYIGDDHLTESRDTLTLYRTFPKVNGNFRGMKKSAIKFTKDFTVLGVDGSNIVVPCIVDVGFSVPVGLTDDQELLMRQLVVGLVDFDDVMGPLMNVLMI
jgi:hypothetical protein